MCPVYVELGTEPGLPACWAGTLLKALTPSARFFSQRSQLLPLYSATTAAVDVSTRSVTAFLSLFPALWQAEELDLGRPLVRPRWPSPPLSHTTLARCPPQRRHLPAAPTLTPAERAQRPPHLLVVLHEAADPLALDLPFRLL